MTLVVNLFGGPGTGKSTNATYIFSELKRNGVVCEYVSEYAKDVTWEETQILLNNQIHVFSEQFRRQWRLLNKVDVIVTDSPLFLGLVYFNHYNDTSVFSSRFSHSISEVILSGFLEFNNMNYFLVREKPYVQVGRNQTEDEARQIDDEVRKSLDDYQIQYDVIGTQKEDADEIVKDVCSTLFDINKEFINDR